jgi:perosamine synthetase
LEIVGVATGDEVLIPTISFASPAAATVHLGAKPVFVDCRPDTLNINPDDLEERITPRTKAIVPVHHGGQPCDMDRIVQIARAHELSVIDDAAHALPARYRDRTVGTLADLTCFSFYATKTITTGEGGMITTAHERLAERARLLRLHGIDRDSWRRHASGGSWDYEIVAAGHKFNMTDVAAALGIEQLSRCEELRRERERCADFYNRAFADVPEIGTPTVLADVQHAWHLYVIQLELGELTIDRAEFIRELDQAGVGTSVHFIPLHTQPYYRDTFGYSASDLPDACRVYERIVSLPIYPKLGTEQLAYVVDTVRRVVSDHHA